MKNVKEVTAVKPAREKALSVFDCAESFDDAVAILKDAKNPVEVTIHNKGKFYVVSWIEKLD